MAKGLVAEVFRLAEHEKKLRFYGREHLAMDSFEFTVKRLYIKTKDGRITVFKGRRTPKKFNKISAIHITKFKLVNGQFKVVKTYVRVFDKALNRISKREVWSFVNSVLAMEKMDRVIADNDIRFSGLPNVVQVSKKKNRHSEAVIGTLKHLVHVMMRSQEPKNTEDLRRLYLKAMAKLNWIAV